MKKVLIVHAHPEAKSFNSSLKNLAVKTFEAMGDEVQVSDLYAMNFNPVGGLHDFKEVENPDFFKYQLEQVHAFQHQLFSDELQAEMDKFLWCDVLIFNFPLWWFGLPAMLKGWVDRVFAMGLTYGAGKGVYDKGHYQEKRAFCCITTGGPEVAYGATGKNGSLDTILFPIHHGMFYFVGCQVLPPFISFSPARSSDEERVSELKRYEDFLKSLDQQLAISF